MNFQLTDKSKNLIKTKIFEDGHKYALCDVFEDGTELWLKMVPEKPRKCSRCGYTGTSLDRHHIYGRKVSDETILLCANCHREIHAGAQL